VSKHLRWLSRGLVAMVVALGVSSGCAVSEGDLSGSLGEFYTLHADEVRARLYDSELSIEYIKAVTGEVSVRVTVTRSAQDPSGPATVNLAEAGNVSGSSEGNLIPDFKTGTLRLDAYAPTSGSEISGDFDITFDVGDTEVALNGTFDTVLEVVSFF